MGSSPANGSRRGGSPSAWLAIPLREPYLPGLPAAARRDHRRPAMAIRPPRVLAPLALAAALAGCGAGTAVEPADLVLTNGKIVTVDPERPTAEAVAIAGEKIIAVGSAREIRAYIGPDTEVLDRGGQLAIPGFIEGHGHFMGFGRARMILDLTTARSWAEIVEQVAEAAKAAQPDEWILGRGWHQEKWDDTPEPTVDGVPLHHSLSAVSPDNPVYLTHASGHASFANARALQLAGIHARTPDPAGGTIVRDASGQPTGLLRERAQRLVAAVIERDEQRLSPEERAARARRMVELAGQELLSKGVTSFHDAGTGFETVDLYRQLAAEGKLPVRLYVMVNGSNDELARKLAEYRTIGEGDGFLTVRSIKRQIDGALGA